MQKVAVITGAAGGMGQAVCRLLGRSQTLILTDIGEERVARLLDQMTDEGFTAVGHAGDLADAATVAAIADLCRERGELRTIVNTAGLSPALAGWRDILMANIVGPEQLLKGLEPLLTTGTAAVMVASVSGHLGPDEPACQDLLLDPLNPDMCDRMEPLLEDILGRLGGTMGGQAYSQSKRAILRMCERRAIAWGPRGARINSISPGGVWTPMGRKESEEGKRVNDLIESTPIRRWGTAMDMATAIEFLASDNAGYITGTDLRVDGGVTGKLLGTNY